MRFARGTSASLAAMALAIALGGCEREERRFRAVPPAATDQGPFTKSELQPGATVDVTTVINPYAGNAYALSEGKRLYGWMNCVGCHANGGGAIGPPLMDKLWIYGSEPENIFATIVEGRPNGMPSFRGKLATEHVWQLVAYVRSLSGMGPKAARPGRADGMAVKPSEQNTEPARPESRRPSVPVRRP